MKILYANVIELHAGWGAEWFVDRALRRLGHETICVDYRQHRQDLAERLANAPPCDAFLLQRGDGFPPELVALQRRPRLFWASELVSRCPDQEPLLASGLFDHVFLHSSACLETVVARGWLSRERCSVLLNGFDPEIFSADAAIAKDTDVVFAGSLTPRRTDWLGRLGERFKLQSVRAYGEDLANWFNRARITLNIHAEEYPDTETRVFEALACGSLVVSERLSQDSPFTSAHLVECDTFDELCAKIEHYLANPRERHPITAAGYREVLAKHRYLHRATEIAAVIERLRDDGGRRTEGRRTEDGGRRAEGRPGVAISDEGALDQAGSNSTPLAQPDSILRPRPSAISSWQIDASHAAEFVAVCETSADALDNFKREPGFQRILEHVTREQGQAYLDWVRSELPWLEHFFARFQENDRLGEPEVFAYGRSSFSPTTLRYVKVLGDLVHELGSLDDLDIVEIGGGYGGQCKVIEDVFRPASYLLIDLPAVSRLQEQYLSACGVPEFRCLTPDEIPDRSWDLVISNYALSELDIPTQEFYAGAVVRKSSAGYLTWNVQELPPNDYFPVAPTIVPESPRTGPCNQTITWQTAPGGVPTAQPKVDWKDQQGSQSPQPQSNQASARQPSAVSY